MWVYTCPITGTVASQPTETLPDRWAHIAEDYFSPLGMFILAHRILKHPDAEYAAILTAPFPSTVYDDWEGASQL